jgi:DNA-binding NarL/FixJ family response regulator
MGITRRMVQLYRAELQLGRGELTAASDTLGQARRAAEGDHPFAGKLFELTAWLAQTGGDFAAARLTVSRGLAGLDGLDDVQAMAWLCLRGLQVEADRAEHARAHRRRDEAAAAAHVAEDLHGRVRSLAALPAARALGELSALELTSAAEQERAAGDNATEAWLQAAAVWELLREPYPQAVSLARAAEAALTARRAKAEVAAWLESAREIASPLGAAPLLRALDSVALRGRLPAQPRRDEPATPAPPRPLGLTPRELDVLRLIAKGYTNARIADTLFISRKTAAAHVSNILGKLEVARRAEAAAIAAQLGVLDEPTPERTT